MSQQGYGGGYGQPPYPGGPYGRPPQLEWYKRKGFVISMIVLGAILFLTVVAAIVGPEKSDDKNTAASPAAASNPSSPNKSSTKRHSI